ncbi:hypothetical protein ACFXPV_10635 [Streptomyces sp. NPDC059118]|uniref:hypothetical protein n=1 Tax=Streptomyces sp. NPDC059118 TaxID=3346731 RepID=UPI00367A1014
MYARRLGELGELHRNNTPSPTYPLKSRSSRAARAHGIIGSRRNLGKVALVPEAR